MTRALLILGGIMIFLGMCWAAHRVDVWLLKRPIRKRIREQAKEVRREIEERLK